MDCWQLERADNEMEASGNTGIGVLSEINVSAFSIETKGGCVWTKKIIKTVELSKNSSNQEIF